MNGHSTPRQAQTQMTYVQKATDSGTPAYALWATRSGAEIAIGLAAERTIGSSRVVGTGFAASCFKSTPAGANGAGGAAGFPSFAQGHERFPLQQLMATSHPSVEMPTVMGIWENWITSPNQNPKMTLSELTEVKRMLSVRDQPAFFSSNFFKYFAGSFSNFALHFLQHNLISCPL
jgi:hypothetical protein